MTPPDPTALPTADNGRDWLALGVAAYGAVVATSVAAYQFVRDRPGVKVSVVPVVRLRQTDDNRELWGINVVNHRKRPITITGAGLLVDSDLGKSYLHVPFRDIHGEQIDFPFPETLTDGTVFQVFVEKRGEDEPVLGAWVRDALRRSYEVRFPSRNLLERFRSWWLSRRIAKARRKRGWD